MLRRVFALAILAGALLLISGCAANEQEDPNRVSTIPWNRPQPWESQGPFGGMMNPEGGY
jgi:hypothetical protein